MPRIAAVLADLPHWPPEIKETCPPHKGVCRRWAQSPGLVGLPWTSGIAVDLSDGGEGSHATALLEPDVAIFDKVFLEPKIYAFLLIKKKNIMVT
ncbi:MAG TPA: hypothetical protein VK097_08130 [Lentibacillus sp.]|uniref:hypothetical protein n=1 Tax=Lentibacillus sp. TaxID=1925746 RepID=UPI002B4AB902|nr:hypothetical protein [Lentibacillus sp.]HLR62396.1 hypothetical protein [Lentibacillus sp.]